MSQFELDMKFVRSLAKLLQETNLSEIEYAEGDKRIRCVGAQPTVQVAAAPAPTAATPAAPATETSAPVPAINGTAVTAPMVGTVYLAPEPGAASFVKVGDKVNEGDTLLIIEAMKVMNPIKAPKGGTIAEILIGDAKPVEFGDNLIVIS